jgi:pimeloyl-ACP methyl ester carboxylesterase
MNRLLAFWALLLAALAGGAAPAQAPSGWGGDWHGTLATPYGPLRLLLTIHEGAGGALTAELESLDQGPGVRIPVDPIAIAQGRLTFAIPMIGASYEGVWHPETSRFSGTFRQGTALPLDLERGAGPARPVIAGLNGRWEGSVRRNGVDLRLIVRIASDPRGTIASLDAPDQLAMGLPVTDLVRDGATVSFTVPASGAHYVGTLSPDGSRMSGRWTLPGAPDAEVVFVRNDRAAGPPARPQTPRPPFPYRSEEVRIPNPRAAGVILACTLTEPAERGPFAGAVLITGSGGQDRDEALLGHRPFAVLADHLSRAGIAVLRCDDRGVAGSTGSQADSTSADFATDANAAFAWLHARPEIDRRSVGFIGHSEGGMIGPLAMRDNPDVAFLVMLAGPGTDIPALMRAQRRAIGESQGMSAADLDRTAPLGDALFAIAASDRSPAEAEAAARAYLTDERLRAAGIPVAQRDAMIAPMLSPWFRYFLRYDPAPLLRRIRVPVLALNGALDRQVIARENLPAIRAALANDRDVTVTELPGLNHLFQHARTGAVGEYREIEETMAPEVLDLVASWIRARFPSRR